MHSIIQPTHLEWNPIFCIIRWRNVHSNLLYALLMSNFKAMCPIFLVFFLFIWWSNSKATRILSEIALSNWKALWDSDMIWGKTFFNMLASTFDTGLYKTLQKAIGWNSVTYLEVFTLGIREIKVWLKPGRIVPEFKLERTALTTSSPIAFQNFWKKIGGMPWGPGALRGAICFSAISTSSLEKGPIRLLFIFYVTTGSVNCTTSSIPTGSDEVNKLE